MEEGSRWSRRLRCPHCQGEFDYDFVPGMSVTALRLGTSRYMRCPLCRRWGRFPLTRPKDAGSRAASESTGVPPPEDKARRTGGAPVRSRAVSRFNDRRPMARWGALVIAPAAALILLGVLLYPSTMAEIPLVAAGAILLGVGLTLLIAFSLPDRTR